MYISTEWSVSFLESDPSCDYKIQHRSTHEELRMWCTVSFRGNWAPVMEWYELRGSSTPHPVDLKYVENRTESNNNVTYMFTINVTSAKLPYTCTTKFLASMRPSATISTNIPYYHIHLEFAIYCLRWPWFTIQGILWLSSAQWAVQPMMDSHQEYWPRSKQIQIWLLIIHYSLANVVTSLSDSQNRNNDCVTCFEACMSFNSRNSTLIISFERISQCQITSYICIMHSCILIELNCIQLNHSIIGFLLSFISRITYVSE